MLNNNLCFFQLFLTIALVGLTSANKCNVFLNDETDTRMNTIDADAEDASPDMDELIFLTEFSRFMNDRAPRLLQVLIKFKSINLLDLHFVQVYLCSCSAQSYLMILGGNSQNFLQKFVRFFLTLKCFYRVVIHRKWVLYDLYSSWHRPLIISASKTTYTHNNPKILRPKVTKNIKNLHKKFCEFPPRQAF